MPLLPIGLPEVVLIGGLALVASALAGLVYILKRRLTNSRYLLLVMEGLAIPIYLLKFYHTPLTYFGYATIALFIVNVVAIDKKEKQGKLA